MFVLGSSGTAMGRWALRIAENVLANFSIGHPVVFSIILKRNKNVYLVKHNNLIFSIL